MSEDCQLSSLLSLMVLEAVENTLEYKKKEEIQGLERQS